MKATPEFVERLGALLQPHDTDKRREMYRTGQFPRSDAVKDLDKRYRWDLFWQVGFGHIALPDDMNDNHIDTALRAVVPSL